MSRMLKKMAVRSGLARLDAEVRRRLGSDYFYLRMYSGDVLSAPVSDLELLENLERAVKTAAAGDVTGEVTGEVTREVIDLSQGIPDLSGIFDASPILESMTRSAALASSLRAYPAGFGHPEALRSVAGKIKSDTGVSYDPEKEILICNGASQALAHALECFTDAGETIVLFDPCYLFYPWLARTRGLRVRRVRGPNPQNGRLNQKELDRAMRGAKAIIVNSPGNPDGRVIHPDDLALVAALAARNNCVIISDEVYSAFCWKRPHESIATIPAARDRTIVVSSVSKSHGLPGLRAGWCAGPAQLIRPLAMLMSIRVPCVSAATQVMMPALLDAESAFAARRHTEFLARRKNAIHAANAAGFHAPNPDGAFYIWTEIPDRFRSGYEFARWCLETCRVAVMPGEPSGPSGQGKVRWSFGVSPEKFNAAMSRVRATTR